MTIYGRIATGSGAPLMIGSFGSIGNKQWHADARAGIQPGEISIELCPYFPEVKAPFLNANTPDLNQWVTNMFESGGVTNVVVEFYDYVFDTGNYLVSTFDGKVLVRGNARVRVTDNLDMTGSQESITIATNASLELFMEGADVRIAGNAAINQSGTVTNFIYYGMAGNTNLSLSANASFTGIIYAPQADIYIGGGGNDIWDFIGAIVARSVRLNGHFRFHYDEALRELSFPGPITSP